MNTETLDRLEALLAKATKGPWELDSERNEDCHPKHHDYFIGGDVNGKWTTIFDTVNSDDKLIEEEFDEEHYHAWDAIGKANGELVVAMHAALPALLSIARRAADVEAIRAVTAKASSEWTGPNPAEFATGVAFVTKPHFVATAVSRYVMGETTPVSIADIGDDEEVGR